ncbi:sensor histidine kinase [Pseudonocardia sichuanensis]
MRRSVLLRLLALSLSVASLAVIATALLATYDTGSRLREEEAGSASRLETDMAISSALLRYANEHRSWDGVETLVRELAQRTGRRIAITTPDGGIVADSAVLLGTGSLDLPAAPAARLDAAAPRDAVAVAAPVGAARTLTLQTDVERNGWQLTAQERDQRRALAAEAQDCLRAAGVDATVRVDAGAQVVASAPAATGAWPVRGHPCVPEELFGPSAAALELAVRTAERGVACLDRLGLAHTVATTTHGLPAVLPPDGTAPSTEWTACLRTARAEAERPFVAPPAQLYLGTDDRFDPFAPDAWLRTGATVAGVLLVAGLVTMVAGRHLVRPIRILTAAAVRMADGHHGARVPVVGGDEVARLGRAFNDMAASVERGERQRTAMIGDVAHELRSPLANVRSQLEAAEDGVLPLDAALVRSLQEECGLLARLVADLQELAMAEAGVLRIHPEERDAGDLAAQAVAAHRGRADAAGVAVRLHAPDPVPVLADPARLRQALGNLVANAVTHTPRGGSVEVAVRSCGESVLLSVTDDGAGITAEHLPHVFDRFYRVDPSRSRGTGGSGLGLAITRHLVEAHGGHVHATSVPGAGSVFTIHLPAGG